MPRSVNFDNLLIFDANTTNAVKLQEYGMGMMFEKRNQLNYELKLMNTNAATGFFSTRTSEDLDLENLLAKLADCPRDEFLHKQLMAVLADLPEDELKAMAKKAVEDADYLFLAALFDASVTNEDLSDFKELFSQMDLGNLADYTPLVYLKSELARDQSLHALWAEALSLNFTEHRPLSELGISVLAPLYSPGDDRGFLQSETNIRAIADKHMADPEETPLKDTIRRALEGLTRLGIFHEGEMRHEASLSPFALQRKWKMDLSVKCGKHNHTLTGIQTSYGKGLTLEAARASNLMEVAERCSSFATIEGGRVTGRKKENALKHGKYTDLLKKGLNVLDPNTLALEVPYEDEALYWICGELGEFGESAPIWVPIQLVFLFCNLDENSLFSGLGSTGLASGNTMEQAKVSALHEIIERHAEATVPFDPSQCFRAVTDEPELKKLLQLYWEMGIQVQFQDLTGPMGIPCCKCFVVGKDGEIAKGTGAHLSAKKALISALTETTYPFPNGPKSADAPSGQTYVPVEALPDYSTGNPGQDLKILEEVLHENGLSPIYVELTREDLDIPVVKAIVPGLELMADFDKFSRIPRETWKNILASR